MIAAALIIAALILAAAPSERITLTKLARQQNVAPSTAWRWATKGVRGIRLPSILIGNKRVTTRAAFDDWCLRLTASTENRPVPKEAAGEMLKDEEARAARAEAELVRLGLNK